MAGSFELVFAATAWHWLDPDIRYLRAWELLDEDKGPEEAHPRPGELPDSRVEIEETGLFSNTSRWSRGNANGCTGRSTAVWRSAPIAG